MASARLLPVVAALALLPGCARQDDSKGARTIDCQLSGEAAKCRVETIIQNGVKFLVVRHPDGGFRRFHAVSDGRGVIPADGADGARGSWTDDRHYAVSVGKDRYLFPARELPDNAPGR